MRNDTALKVYHGTSSTPNKSLTDYTIPDFGTGFYVTDSEEQARKYAYRLGSTPELINYELNLKKLRVCDLNKYDMITVIATIVKYKMIGASNIKAQIFKNKYSIDLNQYDIIIGSVTDIFYSHVINAFIHGDINLRNFKYCLSKSEKSNQICVKNPNALKELKTKNTKPLNDKSFGMELVVRDNEITAEMKDYIEEQTLETIYNKNNPDDIYINDCIRNKYVYDKLKQEFIIKK